MRLGTHTEMVSWEAAGCVAGSGKLVRHGECLSVETGTHKEVVPCTCLQDSPSAHLLGSLKKVDRVFFFASSANNGNQKRKTRSTFSPDSFSYRGSYFQ